MRKGWTAAVLAVCLGVAVVGCGDDEDEPAGGDGGSAAASGETKKVSFLLDFFHSETHSAFFAARDQGFYEEEGLDVEIKPGQGSTVTVQQVAEGNETFGWANATALTQVASKGADVKAVASMRQVSDGGIAYWPDRGISTPADLAGKNCALTAAGFIALLFSDWAERVGLDESAVKKRVVDASAGSALFGSRKVDCTEATAAQVLFYAPVDGVSPGFFKYADEGLSTLGFTIIASNDTITNDPETTEKFVRATLKGWKWACENPDEAATAARENFEEEPSYDAETGVKIWQEACKLTHTPNTEGEALGWMAPEDWDSTLEILTSAPKLEVTDPPPAEELYTNEFVDKVSADVEAG